MNGFTESSPKADLGIKLRRMNIVRAVYDNAVSIPSRAGLALSYSAVPLCLQVTSLQQQVSHHPWLDAFPFLRMRDS